MMSKVMVARFAGSCITCRQSFPAGTNIVYAKGTGARHVTCPPASVVNATPASIFPNPTINQSAIVAFLTAAQAHIKFPKVRFLAPNGKSEMRLFMAGARSRFPGSINVAVDRVWMGAIRPYGEVVFGSRAHAAHLTHDLTTTLERIALNPGKAASDYGALMGRCSFCNLPLTDAGSVAVGYGAVCAKHYGLPHSALGTKAVAVVGHVSAPEPTPEPVPEPEPVATPLPFMVGGIRIIALDDVNA